MAAIPALPPTTVTKVSVEEYIARFVEGGEKPTCEYVDGELFAKPMPTRAHGVVQANLVFLIRSGYDDAFTPITELSTRLRETQFFVPDIAVEDLARPIAGRYPGPKEPVHLCVEIMSPPDRVGKLWGKCEEYHSWGVPYCWVIDPERKVAWEYYPADVEPRPVAERITAGLIDLPLADVFRRV